VAVSLLPSVGQGHGQGRAVARAVSRWLPTVGPGFEPRSGHVGFVVDRVALEQVFFEYFDFGSVNPAWTSPPS
jgi:hypothetical protein